MSTILRKNKGLCQVRCEDCFNYDETGQVGYTCLILGTSRDPHNSAPCHYWIHKTQTRLGTMGAPS